LDGAKAVAGEGVFMGCIACGQCVAMCPTKSITVTGRGMTADDAWEFAKTTPPTTADQLAALLQSRRSIRHFDRREIDRSTVDRILEMAATAPMGIPPSDVGVVVFHGRDRVQAFAKDACEAFQGMGWFFHPITLALMRPMLGKEGYAAMRDFVRPLLKTLVAKRAEGVDLFTYDAPAAMLFHHGPMADAADCHIVATYAMLAAQSMGLGSCLLGTTVGLNQARPFKDKYGIPAKNKIGLAIILGYPTTHFRRGIRRRLASVRFA
jgi:nitroreductase